MFSIQNKMEKKNTSGLEFSEASLETKDHPLFTINEYSLE